MTNPSPLSLREDQIDKLCQWQECAFKHFDEADKDSMREWTRDFLNQAIALSREATPLTAPVASEPTWAKLDIMEAISYCYKTLGHAQGTKGCIAFARGAEWAMDKLRAAPQTPSPVAERMYEFIKHGDAAHCEWLRLACIAFCNGEERPPAIPQTPSPVADETEMRADGCLKVELASRVPAKVALARIAEGLNEADATPQPSPEGGEAEREALTLALRALEDAGSMWMKSGDVGRRLAAIDAIHAALSRKETPHASD